MATRLNKKKLYTTAFISLLFFFTPQWAKEKIPIYKVVIDPGHGNFPSKEKDARWDPVSKKFLAYNNYGSQYKNFHEHTLMLALAKKVKYYLDLSQSNWGWQRFSEYLKRFSLLPKKKKRIFFKSYLTRKKGWDIKTKPKDPKTFNAPYRLFDYKGQKGRISKINSLHPHLLVSLHMTSAGRGHKGGMASVLSPGYKTFQLLRQISLKTKPRSKFFSSLWEPHWLVTRKNWTRLQSAISDTWVYFHGYNTQKNKLRLAPFKYYRGIRHNLLAWKYKDPNWVQKVKNNKSEYSKKHHLFRAKGRFWDRERNQAENWRREGGVLKYGGDNHYASDELLRYAQFGLRLLEPKLQRKNAIAPLQDPYVSSYALPIYVNAIVAYLEIAYINRKRDRKLVIQYRDKLALSLAVGIYSLFEGLDHFPKKISPIYPRGKKINWSRYEKLKGGNYFDQP